MTPRLLDLFCGAGGCSVGYRRAGFDIVGVDLEPHPDYPYEFHQADALDVLTDTEFLSGFDVVHASPPCKRFTDLAAMREDTDDRHPDLLTPTRELVRAWGGVYVIENVEGAPMPGALLLCGSEFDLWADCRDGRRRQLRRHRLFESNAWLMGAGGCLHRGQPVGVYGTGGGGHMTRGYKAHPEEARQAMGIDWMRVEDICQAIPPAYTEFVGGQIMGWIAAGAATVARPDTRTL